jgi:tRNA1Val (adenine37-N6)-methyltransferase
LQQLFFINKITMFRCKQFTIDDNGATMKVGTDAVLLGAMATPKAIPARILDIGTGCGILALMMAQRFGNASVDAIDIDAATITVAQSNFRRSPWSNRLQARNFSLQQFAERNAEHPSKRYDLIVSNPPYFTNSLRNEDPRRRLARHDDNLTLETLFQEASKLMVPSGTMAVILPADAAGRAASAAEMYGLRPQTQTDICNHLGDAPKRSVLHFLFDESASEYDIQKKVFAMRKFDNGYTSEYQSLTSPFLL